MLITSFQKDISVFLYKYVEKYVKIKILTKKWKKSFTNFSIHFWSFCTGDIG